MDINKSISDKSKTYRVALFAYPTCMDAGLRSFADILRAANMLVGQRRFETEIVDVIHAKATGEKATEPYDIVVVPGFWAQSAVDVSAFANAHSALIRAIAEFPLEQSFWGYCTGTCLLAHAGRLDAEPATVTWWVADAMRQQFPDVYWQTDLVTVFGKRVATASGVMGHLPLALTLIEHVLGKNVMREVSRLMVLPRPLQVHQAFRSVNLSLQGTPLLRHLFQIATRLAATELTTSRLAKELNMSERTLTRRVQKDAGDTLAKFARRIKLSQAAERLSNTSQSPAAICEELGFSSEGNMRRMFKAETQMTLSEYRKIY